MAQSQLEIGPAVLKVPVSAVCLHKCLSIFEMITLDDPGESGWLSGACGGGGWWGGGSAWERWWREEEDFALGRSSTPAKMF